MPKEIRRCERGSLLKCILEKPCRRALQGNKRRELSKKSGVGAFLQGLSDVWSNVFALNSPIPSTGSLNKEASSGIWVIRFHFEPFGPVIAGVRNLVRMSASVRQFCSWAEELWRRFRSKSDGPSTTDHAKHCSTALSNEERRCRIIPDSSKSRSGRSLLRMRDRRQNRAKEMETCSLSGLSFGRTFSET